ncbi:AMP-binding protein [Cumulibacter soli]|uniref:AMP-binding protein n=1 Tax=Cumulibacter soli TaxID=2546344 RepID=UPI001067748F|nr:AMP-binding protein [Cumulibacter soli]
MNASAQALPTVIAQRAAQTPDAPYVISAENGSIWTYRDAHQDIQRWARALRRAGIRAGDTVLTMMPPQVDAVAAWLGIAQLRALEVPVNVEYIGSMLTYIIEDSSASIMVVHENYLPAVLQASSDQLRTIVVVGSSPIDTATSVELVSSADFLARAEGDVDSFEDPQGRDTAAIIYTSGTTGPSKGVLVTWRQAELTATGIMPSELFDSADAFYSPFPIFHMSGKGPLFACALVGARVIMRQRFNTTEFWSDVAEYGATTTILLGAMANFLYQQPAAPGDRTTPLRDAMFLPLIDDLDGFSERFGVRARTTFNMTETACCILSDGYNLANTTSCGRIRPGFDARVVDPDDREVAPGELGELVLRSDEPWTLMNGYWGKPEATVDAWRNQWLHTGDGFTRDAEGNFYFVDRIKDAIRRRGENISSAEVEALVLTHPDVLECAAIAVPADVGEDEVKIVLVLQPDRELAPETLDEYLAARMPRFMIPRYIEIVDELPKTPTQKIRKVELRKVGVSPSTWDRRSTAPSTWDQRKPGSRGAEPR